MIKMKELEWKKREELYKGLTRLEISYEEAKKIFESLEDRCLIEIVPPQKEEQSLQWVDIRSKHTGRFSGNSYKPGNIILNIKNAAISSLSFGSSSAASIGAISAKQPLIALFTVLAAVLSAADLGKVALDGNAVLILAVLWKDRCTQDQPVHIENGLKLVNEYLRSHGREEMIKTQYEDLLDDLREVGSITLDNGEIMLMEKIHITY